MQLSSAITTASSPLAPPPASRLPETSDIRLIGLTMHFSRDQEVYGEGEPADQVYKVVSGAVRSFRVLCDGRRQICDFFLPGDLFGVEAGSRRATVEALADTMLIVARRSALVEDRDAGASARRLWAMAVADLQRSQDHVLTLGRRAASERVANFLVELAARLGHGDSLELPMSRQDIADYLGLTIETVSRTFTQLQAAGLIKMTSCRSVRLCRPRALEALCE
jgi:CRP-like cAMP-binding protein